MKNDKTIDEKRREHERTALAFKKFLENIEIVKNVDEEVDKKNPIYNDPIYIEVMKKRGLM